MDDFVQMLGVHLDRPCRRENFFLDRSHDQVFDGLSLPEGVNRSVSAVAKRQFFILPSAVRRMRLQPEQKGCDRAHDPKGTRMPLDAEVGRGAVFGVL